MSLYGEEECAAMVVAPHGRAPCELAGELGSDFLAELAARLSCRQKLILNMQGA